MKKILHLTTNPIISTNGADISAFERLVGLQKKKFETRLVSLTSAKNKKTFEQIIQKFPRKFSQPEITENELRFHYEQQLIETIFTETPEVFIHQILAEYRPDKILIRINDLLTWESLQKVGRKNYLVFLTDNEFPKRFEASQREIELIAGTENFYALSGFLQRSFRQEWNKEVNLEYQLVIPEKYRIKKREDSFITMVNPVFVKGLQIFLALAESLPEKKFMAVGGWNEKVRADFRALAKNFPNIYYQEPTDDMREVYAKTKILLVPSLWEEAFPRVICETQISGIPALASAVGGNGEALGNGGYLLPIDKKNPLRYFSQWRRSLLELDQNEVIYQRLAANALAQAEKYQSLSQTSFAEFGKKL